MASTWKQSITTNAGIALMNKAYGVSSIIPTKAVTITDDISAYSVTQLMALTSVNYNQSRVPIVVSNQANTTRIGIDIDNKDVNEQYDYYGIGVYFKQVSTGEEVLFSVIPLTGAATIIPNQSGVATSSISIDSYTSIVPGTKVDISVSDSGSVTRADVEQIVASNQSYSFPKKPADSGIDLHTLRSIGIYQIKDDKTVVNAPAGFSGNGYITVIGDGTTANPITQDLFDTVTGNKYSNSYYSDGNKWTGWEQLASMSNVTTTLNNGLSTKVTDNKDGTEQLNGVQVNPFNKLSDSVGGRNYLLKSDQPITISDKTNRYAVIPTNLKTLSKGNYIFTADVSGLVGNQTSLTIGLANPSNHNDYNASNVPIINGTVTKKMAVTDGDIHTNIIIYSGPGAWDGSAGCTAIYTNYQLIKSDVVKDWTPAPEDKVNVSDMRKPASDVAGIEEVNTKVTDNKNGTVQINGHNINPFDTSQNVSLPYGLDFNNYITSGNYRFDKVNTINYPPMATPFYWQLVVFGDGNAVYQIAAGNNITAIRQFYTGHGWNPWTQMADDSKVVHNTGTEEIAGTKTFDTAPIDKTTGNPYITKDGVPAVPSTLADTTKPANFTAGLQSGGVDVATAADLKSIVGKSWLSLGTPDGTFTSPDGSTDIGTFVGTPLLMKFDATTGITKFMGNFRVETTHNNTTWKGSVFQIPGGFTVTNPESLLNLLVDVPWSIMGTLTSCHLDGQNIMATIEKDASNSSYTRGIVFSGLGSASGYPQVGKSKTTALITRI